jgi:hypothetical protein
MQKLMLVALLSAGLLSSASEVVLADGDDNKPSQHEINPRHDPDVERGAKEYREGRSSVQMPTGEQLQKSKDYGNDSKYNVNTSHERN